MAAKKKACTCCALHNSTNLGTKVLTKKKWVDKRESEYANSKYRLTFECYADDYQAIHDEIEAYGNILLEEREVEDNG